MPKVYMLCGRICSGKSTFSEKLRCAHRAVILSVDEITLALFGREPGDMLDTYVERTESYLYEKSLQILDSGIDVILDWGFWTRRERDEAREFYSSRGIDHSFYYIDISDDEWCRRIARRNADISEGRLLAYYVDDGLADKFKAIFEVPSPDEQDVIFSSDL